MIPLEIRWRSLEDHFDDWDDLNDRAIVQVRAHSPSNRPGIRSISLVSLRKSYQFDRAANSTPPSGKLPKLLKLGGQFASLALRPGASSCKISSVPTFVRLNPIWRVGSIESGVWPPCSGPNSTTALGRPPRYAGTRCWLSLDIRCLPACAREAQTATDASSLILKTCPTWWLFCAKDCPSRRRPLSAAPSASWNIVLIFWASSISITARSLTGTSTRCTTSRLRACWRFE